LARQAELGQAGMIIGPHDLWLAAACVARGLAMVIAAAREFERVLGLMVEVWSQGWLSILRVAGSLLLPRPRPSNLLCISYRRAGR
jgi:hypothetical protein